MFFSYFCFYQQVIFLPRINILPFCHFLCHVFSHAKHNVSASLVSFPLGTSFVIKDSVNVAMRFPMMHIFGRLQETMIHEINNIINNDKNKKKYNYGKSNWN